MCFPNGYGQVLSALVPGLDIRLNTPVEQIIYSAEGVRVSSGGREFAAKAVLVTVPLGVLQQNVIAFSPDLPTEKIGAIHTLGMGVLNKLVLSFPQIAWPTAPHFFNFISPDRGQWAEWLNLAHYTGRPILVGFNAAEYGTAIEQLSDAELVQSALSVARTMFGSHLPAPIEMRRTSWASDPYSYGSYSFLAVGSSPRDYDILAKDIGRRVFFAGEATSREYAATVHGAYLSGLREAKKITKYAR